MSKVIQDFIDGRGMYEGNEHAAQYADKITKNQIRKYQRYGVPPLEFLNYLKKDRVISPEPRQPTRARTEKDVLNLLWQTLQQGEGNLFEAEALRQAILLDLMPWLRKQSGSAQHIYEKGELYIDVRRERPPRCIEGLRPRAKCNKEVRTKE
jgi:hypothetical protein